MERIATPDVDVDLHGAGKDGFKDGVPPGEAPTSLSADWFNALQEEIASFIEAQGAALIPGDNTQLAKAIVTSRQIAALRHWTPWDSQDVDQGGGVPQVKGIAFKPTASLTGRFRSIWRSVGGSTGGGTFSLSNQHEANRFLRQDGSGATGQNHDILYDATLDLFVIVGVGGTVSTGIDNVDTSETTPGTADLFAVANDGTGILIAAGEYDGADLHLIRSTDGSTWVEQSVPGAAGGQINDVAFAGTVWVAVGETSGGAPLIWTSPDATGSGPYVVRTPGAGPSEELTGVAHSPDSGTIIAVGFDGEIHRSVDAGATWTAVRDLASASAFVDLYAVEYSNGVFVALTRTHIIVSTDDGLTWQILPGVPAMSLSGFGFTGLGKTPEGQFVIGGIDNYSAVFPQQFYYSGTP